MTKINKRKTREERLQEILEGAKKVFLSKGYQKATMEDIIDETELSKGGFYHYYSNKKQILIDLMKKGNIMYMTYNDHMMKLDQPLTHAQKKEIFLEAILDKFLVMTEDKQLYTLFACEMLIEKDFWDIFLDLEEEFFRWIEEKLGIGLSQNEQKLKLISRVMNGLLITQNLFSEPFVFQGNREAFKKFFDPIIEEILQEA